MQFSSPLKTLISKFYSGWGGLSLHLLFILSSFSTPLSHSMEGDACTAEESHLTQDFLIFTQVPLLPAVLSQRLIKTLSWSFGVSSAGS